MRRICRGDEVRSRRRRREEKERKDGFELTGGKSRRKSNRPVGLGFLWE